MASFLTMILTLNRQEYLEEQDHYSWYIIAIVTLSVKAVTIIFLAIILAADSVLPKTTIGEGQKKCNVMIIVTFCLMYLATALPIVSIIHTYIQKCQSLQSNMIHFLILKIAWFRSNGKQQN